MEYCLKVVHCSGISWTTWRRFSDFHHAHEAFESGNLCVRNCQAFVGLVLRMLSVLQLAWVWHEA